MKASILLVMAVLLSAASGCVERKMTVTSEPPGALVTISGRMVGRTPVTFPFTWYGDYEIILQREGGYDTLTTHANINMPPYEIPPFDLLSDLAPWTYTDHRYLDFKLQKTVEPTDEQLIKRAGEYRQLTSGPATAPAK